MEPEKTVTLDKKYPKISIIILNWNGLKDTLECLGSVEKCDYPNFDIIVVDNASSDGSPHIIKEQFPEIIMIKNNKNSGFAEGNNIGIKFALQKGAEYILLLNNDTIVDRNIFKYFLISMQKTPKAGILGGLIYHYHFPEKIWFCGAKFSHRTLSYVWLKNIPEVRSDALLETECIVGCAMFIKKNVFEKIGYFDKRFFLLWEEADFCFRAIKADFQCLIVPQVKIWHKISISFKKIGSPWKEYFNARNRLLWGNKNLKFPERYRFDKQMLNIFFPCVVELGGTYALIKRLCWDFRDMIKDRYNFWAKIVGVKDYFFCKFGSCPAYILRLNKNIF